MWQRRRICLYRRQWPLRYTVSTAHLRRSRPSRRCRHYRCLGRAVGSCAVACRPSDSTHRLLRFRHRPSPRLALAAQPHPRCRQPLCRRRRRRTRSRVIAADAIIFIAAAIIAAAAAVIVIAAAAAAAAAALARLRLLIV